MNLDTSKPIKSVSYNGVDVPVYNPPDAPVLLWVNANPSVEFPAQALSVASGYDAYLVRLKYSTGTELFSVVYVPVGFSGWVGGHYTNSQSTSRNITVNDGSISFQQGYQYTGRSNAFAVPTHIWGVKFTL